MPSQDPPPSEAIAPAPTPSHTPATVAPDQHILFFRDQPVLLDRDLAALYGVTPKALNQAVRRNATRFPDDFLFILNSEEIEAFQRTRAPAKAGRGQHRKYPPLAFTEYGVAMLSSVLRSERAVQVNIEIMRAFGRLRGLAAAHTDIARRLDMLEAQVETHNTQFRAVFDAIRDALRIFQPAETPVLQRRHIGFTVRPEDSSV